LPAGRGVFVENITMSGDSFHSTIHYQMFDASGKLMKGGGDAKGSANPVKF
jgi:hypothetical protein